MLPRGHLSFSACLSSILFRWGLAMVVSSQACYSLERRTPSCNTSHLLRHRSSIYMLESRSWHHYFRRRKYLFFLTMRKSVLVTTSRHSSGHVRVTIAVIRRELYTKTATKRHFLEFGRHHPVNFRINLKDTVLKWILKWQLLSVLNNWHPILWRC